MRDYDVNEPVEMREEMVYDGRECVSLGELNLKECKPKKQGILRDYEIRIKFLSVGCIISVGCKEIPFRSVKEAMEELNKYVENPYEEWEKWNSIFDGGE
jgi:hypothetical protein